MRINRKTASVNTYGYFGTRSPYGHAQALIATKVDSLHGWRTSEGFSVPDDVPLFPTQSEAIRYARRKFKCNA